MKYVLRIIAFPFVLPLHLIACNYHGVRNAIYFLMYGGEWISYSKRDEKDTIAKIYDKLKESKA